MKEEAEGGARAWNKGRARTTASGGATPSCSTRGGTPSAGSCTCTAINTIFTREKDVLLTYWDRAEAYPVFPGYINFDRRWRDAVGGESWHV